MSRVYTLPEAAKYLRVSTKWLRETCKTEGLTHIHMAEKLLFTEQHLEQILQRHEVTPSAPAPRSEAPAKPTPRVVGEVVELRSKVPYRMRQQTS